MLLCCAWPTRTSKRPPGTLCFLHSNFLRFVLHPQRHLPAPRGATPRQREEFVTLEIIAKDPDSLQLTLSGDEIQYLRLALERATFLDTPPQHQRAIYNFADELLRRLESLFQ